MERARLYKAANEPCFGVQIATNNIAEGVKAAKLAQEAGRCFTARHLQLLPPTNKPVPSISCLLADDGPLSTVSRSEKPVSARDLFILIRAGAAWLDINCGCPIYEATKRGLGAALLRKPTKLAKMVAGIAAQVDLPVTVKIRAGQQQQCGMLAWASCRLHFGCCAVVAFLGCNCAVGLLCSCCLGGLQARPAACN